MPNTHTLTDAVDFTQLLAPASRGAGAATGSTYIDMRGYEGGVALISVGALGTSATLDAKIVQASDSSGTGSKNLTNASITQLTQASNDGSNKLYAIEFRTPELDTANGFYFVQVTGTVGTAASVYGVDLLRHRGRNLPVTTSLTQQVKV